MKKRFSLIAGFLLIFLVVLIIFLFRLDASDKPTAPAWNAIDPQTLIASRWFLNSMLVDGEVTEFDELILNVQFEEGGKANGEGGCNSFFAMYLAGGDGSLSFGPIGSTKMACAEGMELEAIYFTALSRIEIFRTSEGQLTLSSIDGQTVLTFNLPPK